MTTGPVLPAPPPSPRPPRWLPWTAAALAVVVVLGAVGAGVGLWGQRAELAEARDDVAQLRAEVDRAEQELARAEADPGDGGGGALDDLDGLFGDSGAQAAAVACMQPPGGVDVPDVPAEGVEEQVAGIGAAVEALRGLEFDGEPPVTFRPDDEFVADLRDSAEADYPPDVAAADAARLSALGAIPDDVDLRELQLELLGEQAAGFYRPETGEVVVRGQGEGALTAQERVILAHELEHALVDQQLGLPEVAPDAGDLDLDRATARLAAVEGGAVLVQNQFTLATLGLDEQLELGLDPELQQQLQQLEDVPHVLRRELLFPYEEGFVFACDHYREGGVDALDALVADPPPSTAPVLFDDRAGEERPEGPPAGALSQPWTEATTAAFGPAELLWLLEAPGDDPGAALDAPRERAAGWDGGTATTWTRGDASAVGLALAQRDGEPSLCDTMAAWHEAAFPAASPTATQGAERRAAEGGGHGGVVACDGGVVRVGVAPTLADARRLVDAG